MGRQHLGDRRDVGRFQSLAEQGDDMARLALLFDPVLILLGRDGVELDVDAQLMGFEK